MAVELLATLASEAWVEETIVRGERDIGEGSCRGEEGGCARRVDRESVPCLVEYVIRGETKGDVPSVDSVSTYFLLIAHC